jgi:PAS domain S-box-containing protein
MTDKHNAILISLIDLCKSLYPDNIITNLNGDIIFLGESYSGVSINKKTTHFTDYFFSNETNNNFNFQEFISSNKIHFSTKNEQKNRQFTSTIKIYPQEEFIYFHNTEKQIESNNLSEFYKSILDNLPADIAIFDSEHRYLYINQHGVKNKEIREFLIGKTDFDYCTLKNIDTTLAENRRKIFNEVISTKKPLEWEDHLKQTDGTTKTVYRRFFPIYNNSNEFQFVIGYGFETSLLERVEELINSNEQKYLKLFNSVQIGVFMVDMDANLLEANNAFAEIFGFKNSDELINLYSKDLINSIDQKNEFLHLTKRKGTIQNELVKTRDIFNNTLYIQVNAKYEIVNGVEIISGSIIDVTELKQSEKNLRISNEKLQLSELFLNNSTDAIQVFDEQGKFVLINEAGAKILGIKKEEIKNYTIYDIEPIFTSTQIWDDHVANIKKHGIVFAEGTNKNFITGEFTPIDIRVSYIENKGAIFILASGRDISEKKKIELLLSEKEKNLNSLKEIIDLSSIVTYTDKLGVITQANNNFYKISGYNEKEVIGETHKIINSGYHSADFWENFWNQIKHNQIWRGSIKNKNKQGDFYWVDTIIYPFLDEHDEIKGYISIRHDITEVKEAEINIAKQLELQNLLLKISTSFINLPLNELETGIESALQKIGQFVCTDRAYIFSYDESKNTATNTFEWCAINIEPQISKLKNVPFDHMTFWIEKHFKGEKINIPNVSLLEDGIVKSLLEVQNIKSIITIPLMQHKKCIGFVGFDSVSETHFFKEDEKIILQLFSELIVNVNMRIEKNEELTHTYEEIIALNKSLEERISFETKKNTELSSNLMKQENLTTIGEIAAGIAHDLNTPLGAVIVGAESLEYLIGELLKDVIWKSSKEQIEFACNHATEIDKTLPLHGLQGHTQGLKIKEMLDEQYPNNDFNKKVIANQLIKSGILVSDVEKIDYVMQSVQPEDFVNLIYHLNTIRNFLDTIKISGNKASNVVKNLRNFMKYDNALEKESINIYENITTVLNVFNFQIKHNLELSMNVDNKLNIIGYDIKLYQLWSNLIKNAIDACPKGGELSIYSVETPTHIQINIENTGETIPKEIMTQMFTKFFTTKGKAHGTGLGLTIVKNVIDEHFATIQVSSEDNLTRFTIDFPK